MLSSKFSEVVLKLAELQVNVGLIGTIVETLPEHVQENWVERQEEIIRWAQTQIEEVQEFASAFD